jgi:3-oxoacyl-[acyl-carrier protein] reductase
MEEHILRNKNAVVYGAAGAIGGAVAQVFARQGARVFLTGRTLTKVEAITNRISASGRSADAAEVDALDEDAIENHLDAVLNCGSRVDD